MKTKILIGILFFTLPVTVHASEEFSPIVGAGLSFNTGDSTKSISGSTSYFLDLHAEQRKGLFRINSGLALETGSGTAWVGTTQPSFTLYDGQFLLGFNVFPFASERFQPFLGASGILGLGFLKLGAPTAASSSSSSSIFYGYEFNAGIDIRGSSSISSGGSAPSGTAFRIQTTYYSTTSSLAGLTGFVLAGLRLSLGLVF